MSAQLVRQRRARPLLGTLVDIAAEGDDAAHLTEAVSAAFAEVERVHRLMSFHDPASELSQLNRMAHRRAVTVSQPTFEVLAAALRFAALSDGLFDPTVAPRLCEWGYLPRHAGVPEAAGDWRDIEPGPGAAVRFRRPVQLDLGGIAKGYAVDRALARLRRAGVRRAVVNAGGDLALFGDAPQPVHVRHPREPGRCLRLAELREGAVATSAGYFSARRRGGGWISPLLHPRSRAPLALDASVSVLAADCMSADALTKVVAADPAGAAALLERCGATACRVEPAGPGRASALWLGAGARRREAA